MSFNGGKDCTVLLWLWDCVVEDWREEEKEKKRSKKREDDIDVDENPFSLPPFPALYVKPLDPFTEVEEFVDDSGDR